MCGVVMGACDRCGGWPGGGFGFVGGCCAQLCRDACGCGVMILLLALVVALLDRIRIKDTPAAYGLAAGVAFYLRVTGRDRSVRSLA